MTTTPTRRKAALEEIRKAIGAKPHCSVIHYACAGFEHPNGRVAAIAVRNIGTGVTTLFDVTSKLPTGQSTISASAQTLDTAELAMLDDFDAFTQRNPNHYWLHWNMRNAKFGFDALERRHRSLGGHPSSSPPPHLRVDLASRMFDLYGDRYAAPPSRLETLALKNGLATKDLIDGEAQGVLVANGDYRPVEHALLNRVDLLYSIAIKTGDNTLKTDAKWYDGIGGLGNVFHWIKEHPGFSAIVVIGALLALLANAFKVWNFLPHG